MATIGEWFVLCPIFSEKHRQFVSPAKDNGCVIVTHKSRCIDVYKVNDQKTVHSWSLRHGSEITGPVIYNSLEQIYAAVINKKEIRTWGVDQLNLDKAKKRHTSQAIYRVFSCENSECVVLLENGNVDLLSRIKELSEKTAYLQQEEIIWSDAITCNDSVAVCFVSRTEPGNLTVHFRRHGGQGHSSRIQLTVPDKTVSYCCSVSQNVPTLYMLDSNGCLYCASESGGPTVKSHKLPGVFEAPVIAAFNESHIAVAGVVQEKKNGLGIFDVKFGSLLAWKAFPEPHFTVNQLFTAGRHLYLPCGQSLYACEYDCQPCTLACAMGTFRKTEESPIGDNWASTVISWNVGDPQVRHGSNEKVLALFERLNHPTKTPTLESFQASFEQLVKLLEKPDWEEFWSSPHMAAFIRRVVAEKRFWPQRELLHVIKRGYVPPSVIAEFFEALIEHTDLVLLHASMTSQQQVPEAQLVNTLNVYLRCGDGEFGEVCDETIEDLTQEVKDDSPISPFQLAKTLFINAVLSQPYNDVFLLECMRKVSFEHVLVLLQYLYYLLSSSNLVDSPKANTPGLPQVVDWMCLLVDAHATQLILSPDARALLVTLHQLVFKQMQFYDELISLEAVLSQLKERCVPVKQKRVGMYCIEVLHVR